MLAGLDAALPGDDAVAREKGDVAGDASDVAIGGSVNTKRRVAEQRCVKQSLRSGNNHRN